MKALFKYTLPALAIATLAACSEDSLSTATTEPVDPNAGKELIALSQDDGVTRATLTRAGFSAETKVVMRIRATEKDGSGVRYTEAEATASAAQTHNHSTDHNPADAGSATDTHSDLTYDTGYERYWDDAFGRKSKLTIWAFAIPNKTDAPLPTWSKEGWSKVDANTNPNWYTDAAADVEVVWSVSTQQTTITMGKEDLTYSYNIRPEADGGNKGRYHYTHDGTKWYLESTLQNGEMIWQPKDNTDGQTTGKFDQGHLIFNHALAKIEINLKEGTDFNNSSTGDFNWTNPTSQSITLKNFYTKGNLNVSTGSWSGQTTSNITKIVEGAETTASTGVTTKHLTAYIVPGNDLYAENDNVISFEIDNGQYNVTGKQIAEAIRAYYGTGGTGADGSDKATRLSSFTTTAQGEHYIVNLTVNKKKIERITAAVLPWEEVNSNETAADNTYLDFTFEDHSRGTRLEDAAGGNQFRIYRAAKDAGDYITAHTALNYEWAEDYRTEGSATKTWNAGTNENPIKEWETNWFWPDNKTFYHFRAAGIAGNTGGEPSMTINNNSTNHYDYFTISHGAIAGPTYKDYIWGAPFKTLASAATKLTYSKTYGFDNTQNPGANPDVETNHQISKAIAATDDVIHMLMFHVTSQVFVNVTTTKTADKVTLYEAAAGEAPEKKTKVEILNFLPTGEVRMGNGLVSATGERVTQQEITYGDYTGEGDNAAKITNFKWGVVPQALSWSTPTAGTIGLRITTPDGNQYLIRDLSTCTATVTTNNLSNPYEETGSGTARYTIDRWYPNYQYTYNITVTKKGIERITAAVVGWEVVNGDNIPIDLEN
jgi:hypothetical protein